MDQGGRASKPDEGPQACRQRSEKLPRGLGDLWVPPNTSEQQSRQSLCQCGLLQEADEQNLGPSTATTARRVPMENSVFGGLRRASAISFIYFIVRPPLHICKTQYKWSNFKNGAGAANSEELPCTCHPSNGGGSYNRAKKPLDWPSQPHCVPHPCVHREQEADTTTTRTAD